VVRIIVGIFVINLVFVLHPKNSSSYFY